MWTNNCSRICINKDHFISFLHQNSLSCERILGWSLCPSWENLVSLYFVIWFLSCLMKWSGVLLLEALSLWFGDGNCLITRVLSWHFLELVRKICTLLGFFLVPCFLLARSLEEYKDLQPPLSWFITSTKFYHYCLLKRLLQRLLGGVKGFTPS